LIRAIRVACAALLLGACAPAIRGATPAEQVRSLRGWDAVAVLHSGEEVVLRAPVVEGDSVIGGWTSGPAGDVRVAVALADIRELRRPAPSAPRRPEKLTAGGFVRQSLLIGFAACAGLLLNFAVFGM
jgi:hypothetical protein